MGLIPDFMQNFVCVPWSAVRNAKWALGCAQGWPATQTGSVLWFLWWEGPVTVDGGKGRCQCEPGLPAQGAALLLNTGIHLVLPLEAPPVPAKPLCWALLPLPPCQPGDTALQSRTSHWFLLFGALRAVAAANLTALLSWKWGFHCSLAGAGSGQKSNFLWLLPPLDRLWNQPPSAGFSWQILWKPWARRCSFVRFISWLFNWFGYNDPNLDSYGEWYMVTAKQLLNVRILLWVESRAKTFFKLFWFFLLKIWNTTVSLDFPRAKLCDSMCRAVQVHTCSLLLNPADFLTHIL